MAAPFHSLKGQFLLDGGNLRGSWFHRTVVLVCHHDPEGAFGLVLNRPAGQRVGDALPKQLPEVLREQRLLVGGPVQQNALSYLHLDAFLPGAKVLPNLDLGHDLDELVELGESFSPTRRLLVFAGYAGWSPGQLDDELRRDAWLTHPACPELVFEHAPETLWRDILRLKGWQYRLLADGPEDFSVN
jgi:putative transcriptional regulator